MSASAAPGRHTSINVSKDMHPSRTDTLTTITASDRLARHLHLQAADAAIAADRLAWERPDILTVGAFWRRLFERLQEDGRLSDHLPGGLAESAWWEQAVADTFSGQPLLQVTGAARTAQDAWKLVHDWQLDAARLENDFLDEARYLHRWGKAFENQCRQRGWIPEYRLPDRLLDVLAGMNARERAALLPQRIRLAGFLEFTPRQREWWRVLEAFGVEVGIASPPSTTRSATRLACTDPRDEHRRIAAWAARRLRDNPRQRIGVVVPELATRRDALCRQLLETLAPRHLPTFEESPLPFNVSLGRPLAEQSLVRGALEWLASLEAGRIAFPAAARLCRSPYFAPAGEFPARYSLESTLRERGYAECSLREWAFVARSNDCEVLADAIEHSREELLAARRAGQRLPSGWARTAADCLATARWCHPSARTLDSAEFQAREAFTGLLGRLAELDDAIGATSFGVALGWLRRLAVETLFQPRAADAPVQVLGLFEATGMTFDALWVAGLDDATLPAAPHPNPFLPLALQREHQLPQSSAKREQLFARQLFDGLLGAAPEVTCSFAAMDGDAERHASPLLDALPEGEPVKQLPGIADAWLGVAAMETVEDETAPRFAADRAGGGTRLLEDQSACPFRAFAAHRLAAGDWPTPKPGPDAMMRGSIVHDVLDALWRRWRSRAELQRRQDGGELDDDIVAVVDAVLAQAVKGNRHRWRDSLAAIERDRLAKAVRRWVERVELQRPEFQVIEIEGTPADAPPAERYEDALTPVQAGGLRLRGKLDRVDRLADGSELIIDYKTGNAPSPAQFFGARPRAPQLPAYVVARRQAGRPTPAGIAVASLKAGKLELRGVMRTDDSQAKETGINGVQPVHKTKAVQDWDEAVHSWEAMIASLGDEFVAGHAAVDPLPGACDYCHLQTLCRIHEIRREDAADEDAGVGDD